MRTLLALGMLTAAFGVSAADDKKDPTNGKWVIESVTIGRKGEVTKEALEKRKPLRKSKPSDCGRWAHTSSVTSSAAPSSSPGTRLSRATRAS